ncbi:hypothetical protein OYT1_ch2129 [Ferriphaselus amnicola]|uniref:Uncharacterized protein n=1 Tax=Ferriphaselus amnicola TaxID=1188319 RepID=A0A2Z6GEF1_9PROT|nr:hypothetical protein [Ferriphaselus amnicola]BBE51654.1 hypothetical protein OYT1_ch2129 [Ferriphaselus amnicola]
MRYATFSAGPWLKPSFIATCLSHILPRANPDFQSAYENVQRELAFNASGKTVAAAPLGKNCGIFTDLGSAPKELGAEIASSSFEQRWQEFECNWLAAQGQQASRAQ